MRLSASYTVGATRDMVFGAITDPSVLQRCIEGCEKMVKTGEDSYDAHLKIGLAGLKGSYTGKVQVRDQKPPESYTLVMDGKGAPGFVKGTARIQLEDCGGKTGLRCEADVQVGGMIAAVGSRLVEATAKKIMHDFFRKFGEAVSEKG